jgi:tRNA1Val (adenine37-N6)-methyltransferase
MTLPFRFKEFSVSDTDCGMKLSSDAVLLGTYAKPPQTGRILDIGCGCGILSLMMAQKSKHAVIDNVEINIAATKQANENFIKSKWADRLSVFHEHIQEFAKKATHNYDCIISNPPYFHNQLKSADMDVSQSKHTAELDHHDLCACVSKLLHEKGLFWVILPTTERISFLNTALQHGLFCKKMLSVFDKADKPAVRNIFCLGKELVLAAEWEELVIREEDDKHTHEYVELTKPFYLGY